MAGYYSALVLGEIHNWSKYPRYLLLGSRFLPLSSMVLRTKQTQSGAYRQDNHLIASTGKALDNGVLQVD